MTTLTTDYIAWWVYDETLQRLMVVDFGIRWMDTDDGLVSAYAAFHGIRGVKW